MLTLKAYAPKPKQTISEWVLENISIPSDNARPGPVSFRDAPYQRGILDACMDPRIYRVSVKSAAQIGKTLISLGIIGYYTLQKPRSQVVMQSSKDDLRKWLQTKFDPIVDANPELRRCYAKPRGREGTNNAILKSFKGGNLILAWGGSTKSARGISAPIVICDEVDAYEYSKEGHPADLLGQRAATFGSEQKIIELSTPTVENASRISDSYADGDRRQFFVICPECKSDFTLEWEYVRWKDDDYENAKIHCPTCDASFDDYGRIALVRYAEQDGGGWRASRETKRHASFHVNALYSPLRRLIDIIDFHETLKRKNKPMTTFINTCLGLAASTGDSVDAGILESRVEEYAYRVPPQVKILTFGADVHGDRIEAEVVGWGEGEESWNIDYQIFWGPTDNLNSTAYRGFAEYLKQSFETDGGKFYIFAGGIDSGFNMNFVYEFIHEYQRKVPCDLIAIKGVAGWTQPDVRYSRPKNEQQLRRPALWTLAVDKLKQLTMHRLARKKPGPGYCHFPTDRVDGEYFNQLASEKLTVDPKTGRLAWEKRDYGGNEAWDCRIYAYGALKIVDPDLERPRLTTQYGFFKPKPKGTVTSKKPKRNKRTPLKSSMGI